MSSSHRRQRVAESLMTYFEEWAKSKVVLSPLATRRAATFYQVLEYEESAAYLRKLLWSSANNKSGPRKA